MSPYPLTNVEIQTYYQKEPRCNGAYSRNDLSKVKNGPCVIYPDEYKSIGTHWVALYVIALELNICQKKLKHL